MLLLATSANDLFYLASTSATLREGANETYLLRVGRGGGAETESSVLVKISDVTAEYGKDYTVSGLDGSAKVEVPEGNVSLMDLIAGQPFELTELKDENEAEAILAEDEEGMAAAEAGVAEALNYLAERSGLADAELAERIDHLTMAHSLAEFGVNGDEAGIMLFRYLITAEAGGDAEAAWNEYLQAWEKLVKKYSKKK